MSLMSSLYIGVSGLRAGQNSLNTTAHNLANIDTKGFVRQQALQVDSTYLKWGESYISTFQTGLGTDIAAIRQVRDMFLDKSYRSEIGRQGFYESGYDTVSEIESMFGELEGVTYQNTLNNLWTSIQELSKEPGNIVKRSSLIETAVNFIEHSENISKQLNEYQTSLNTQILEKVNKINDIASQIDKINKKIRQFESNKMEHANDLRDERNLLLDDLSQIINITYKEKEDGVITVKAEGVPLITEDTAYQMDTVKVNDNTDMLKPIWPLLGDTDVFNFDRAIDFNNNTDIGSLKGLLIARGSYVANYTNIPKDEDYDTPEAYENAVLDYNNGVGASVIMTIQAQFDQLIHGVVTAINDVLCPNKKVTLSDGTDLFILDTDIAPVGMGDDNIPGEALFNRKSLERYRIPTADEIAKSGGFITADTLIYIKEEKEDRYTLYTIGEIEVNPEILRNYSKLPLSIKNGTGYDMERADELTKAWQREFAKLSPNTLTKCNINDYYQALIAELANRGEQYNTISINQAAMAESIDNKRQETAGVSSDEELTNLIKYQHAYNASARYISVISEMLEHIVTRL